MNDLYGLKVRLIRRYFQNRGGRIREEVDLEAYAVVSLPRRVIRRIVRFREPEFIDLTKCDKWRVALK